MPSDGSTSKDELLPLLLRSGSTALSGSRISSLLSSRFRIVGTIEESSKVVSKTATTKSNGGDNLVLFNAWKTEEIAPRNEMLMI